MKNWGLVITPVAIILMLLGSLVLDNTPLTMGAAVLLMVGALLMPRQEGLQGWMPTVSLIGVAALVILLRSIR